MTKIMDAGFLKDREERRLFIGHPKFGKTKEEHRKYYYWYRHKDLDDYNSKRLAWADKHRDKLRLQRRKSHLNINFNITIEEFDEMMKKQNYSCVICGYKFDPFIRDKSVKYAIDHDHESGAIRGILCRACNSGLGYFKDSPDIMQKATDYLHKFSINPNKP
jgi:hypothetical protein